MNTSPLQSDWTILGYVSTAGLIVVLQESDALIGLTLAS